MRIISLLFVAIGMTLAQAQITWRPTLHKSRRIAAADLQADMVQATSACFDELRKTWSAMGFSRGDLYMASPTHFVRTDEHGVTTIYTKDGFTQVDGLSCTTSRDKRGVDALADELNTLSNQFGERVRNTPKALVQLKLALVDCARIGGRVQTATYNVRNQMNLPAAKTQEADSQTHVQF